MSLASSITTFLIDVSPSMGKTRVVKEWVELAGKELEETKEEDEAAAEIAQHEQEDGMDGELNDVDGKGAVKSAWVERKRETTNLKWGLEFVGKRVQTYVHAGLKTGKVYLVKFGGTTTNNGIADTTQQAGDYHGIDELYMPAQPDMSACEIIRTLEAATEEQDPYTADPLNAVIAAIFTLADKARGGISTASRNTWTRTIYIVTDGMTDFDKSDANLIVQRLTEERITLKVIGIDFDDPEYGIKEVNKPAVKRKNEIFWHRFLAELPGSGLATAEEVIEQAHMPAIVPKRPAPTNTTLTFGDPERQHVGHDVLGIAVCMYKATTLVRPMSAKKLSKIAQQSAAGKEEAARAATQQASSAEEPGFMTYGVEAQRKYYILEEIRRMSEEEMQSAVPLPEGSEETFIKAYKLGTTHIPVERVQDTIFSTKQGLEILQFHPLEKMRRWFVIGETSYVMASPGNAEAQLKLSALIKAMHELGKVALVRNVRKDDVEPKIAILIPVLKGEEAERQCEHFIYADMPFAEDFKHLTFPPLNYVIDRNGVEHREHRFLPTQEMQTTMDDLVDAMDLTDAFEDPDGERYEWFDTKDSFNPAIHRIKEAVEWRVFNPGDKTFPKPHYEVDKFLKRPEIVWQRSQPIAKHSKELFELEYSADAYIQKREQFFAKKRAREEAEQNGTAEGEDGEEKTLVLEDSQGDPDDTGEPSSKLLRGSDGSKHPAAVPSLGASSSAAGQETKPDDEGDYVMVDGDSVKIGASDPIKDFRRALDTTTDPAEVIRAMNKTIVHVIDTSMASNSYNKAREAMRACRNAAAEEDEAEEWNNFIRKLKQDIMSDNLGRRTRKDFWERYVRGMYDLGLITTEQDSAGRSNVTSKEGAQFIEF